MNIGHLFTFKKCRFSRKVTMMVLVPCNEKETIAAPTSTPGVLDNPERPCTYYQITKKFYYENFILGVESHQKF